MIGYLKGNVLFCEDNSVIIETNGVGFELLVSEAVATRICVGKEAEVYVYTAVKEDGISLYGFVSPEEKKIFLSLISVSGVGPKMGITILSGIGVPELCASIASEDVKTLSSVKGVGKKTAERIILELKDKLPPELCIGATVAKPKSKTVNEDALLALISLGFTRMESEAAVKEAEGAGETAVERIVAYALKHIR